MIETDPQRLAAVPAIVAGYAAAAAAAAAAAGDEEMMSVLASFRLLGEPLCRPYSYSLDEQMG